MTRLTALRLSFLAPALAFFMTFFGALFVVLTTLTLSYLLRGMIAAVNFLVLNLNSTIEFKLNNVINYR